SQAVETSMTRPARPPRVVTGDDRTAADGMEMRITALFGKRYADCRLSNWQFSSDADAAARQKRVLEAVRKYGQNIGESIASGTNVILAGTPGTGKDRFLVSLAR